MKISSFGATAGRNFCSHIKEGEVAIINSEDQKAAKEVYTVESGEPIKVEKHSGEKFREKIIYGQCSIYYLKKDFNIIIYYKKGSNKAVRRLVRKYETSASMFGVKGTLKFTLCGIDVREFEFTYPNGKVGYYENCKFKRPLVYNYPDGKPYIEVITPTSLDRLCYKNIADSFFTYGDNIDNLLESSVYNTLGRLRDSNYITYDKTGGIKEKGETQRYQKVGEWVKNGETKYYISGVEVDKELYFTPPEELNVLQVLGIENTQLRAALMSKITTERLLKETDAAVISKTLDGNLYEIPTPHRVGMDTVIKILEVTCPTTQTKYYLRVPPNMINATEARDWTFKAPVKFIKET